MRYFVEPSGGSLRRAVSKRHHIVFGRRGSGKSSLLRKAAADLTVERRPIAWVDMETFKGHSYPDLLISVLIATFESFSKWLQEPAIAPANRLRFWNKWFGQKPKRPAHDKRKCQALVGEIETAVRDLKTQLHATDEAQLTSESSVGRQDSSSSEMAAGVEVKPIQIGTKLADSAVTSKTQKVQEQYKRSKVEFLRRHIMDYQVLFDRLTEVAGGEAYLFLDDLYHIRRVDQPQVVDYFHSIAKGHNVWLKVGTIRHRTEWYVHGNPPVGMKLGDDAEEIDLDLTLEKYAITKEFLSRILSNLAVTQHLNVADIITPGGLDRFVLASGGVARDFLSIVRRAIDVARERGAERITAEDVNMAAGEYDTSKREEFKRDTSSEDEGSLDRVFQHVRNFCLETANSNCFLIDKDAHGDEVEAIYELVDLKLLHLIRSRVTVSKRQGRIYEAYMLDLSQYAGARKRRGLEIVEFWSHDSKEKLRKSSWIYLPNRDTDKQAVTADDAKITGRKCPHCGQLCPSYRQKCKHCRQPVNAVS